MAATGANHVDGDLRDQLIRVGSAVVQAGLVVGSGGNLSARLPGSDEFWVTGAGTWLDRLERRSFVSVRISDGVASSEIASATPLGDEAPAGTTDEGSAVDEATDLSSAQPSTELNLHLATYRARPDVNAIVHLHPQTALLLTAFGESIRLLTTDHAVYLRRIAVVPFHPPASTDLAQAAAAAAGDGTNCVILAHHGCSVLGATVEMAHRRAMNLEEAARLTYRTLVLTGALAGRTPAGLPTGYLADPSAQA